MKITRRNFVEALGVAAAVTVSPGVLKTAFGQATLEDGVGPADDGSPTLFSMTAAEVQAFIGRPFVARSAEGQSTELVLTEVNSVVRRANWNRGYTGECFSMIFKSHQRDGLDQAVYEMWTSGLDKFSALLVPTGRGREDYELIVNHLNHSISPLVLSES